MPSQQQITIVYRVQDANGRGPWKPGFSHLWVEDRDDHDNLIPWYTEFGQVQRKALSGMTLGTGCRTLAQLQRWFTASEYATLHRYGYRAVKMRVVRLLAESTIQCVFERNKPLAESMEFVSLYPLPFESLT